MTLHIVCGSDPRERRGLAIFQMSIQDHASMPVSFIPLAEKGLRDSGLYARPHEIRNGSLWCPISEAPMATAFAISRFLVPWLVRCEQWVLFADGADMLALKDIAKLFALADDKFAVMTVHHEFVPTDSIKMDNQIQTQYPKKGWSSLCLWNLHHRANSRLTLKMVNELPGRDLHRFCWLEDDEIGELPHEWNYLVGIDQRGVETLGDAKPSLLHYTLGSPELGYKGPWAQEWLNQLAIMDATRNRIRAA